jgi:UDP-3-O-[3-hydroxymyristoyl] glucosamine N-acyltransferase
MKNQQPKIDKFISSIKKPNFNWLSNLYSLKKDKSEKVINFGLIESLEKNLITFAENKYYYDKAVKLKNAILIFVNKDIDPIPKNNISDAQLVMCENPSEEFYNLFSRWVNEIHYPKSVISSTSKIHPQAIVSELGVVIEDNVSIGPNTLIERGVHIGRDSNICSNVILGEDGFEVKKINSKNRIVKHDGLLIIGDGTSINSLSKIDKGMMGVDTHIGKFVTIDSFVHIGHSVSVGCESIIVSNSTICGSCCVGKSVYIGPGCTISNGVDIGDKAKITLGSTVISNVSPSQRVSGYFSFDHNEYLKQQARLSILSKKIIT